MFCITLGISFWLKNTETDKSHADHHSSKGAIPLGWMTTQPRATSLRGQNVFTAKTNDFLSTDLFLQIGPATGHVHSLICWHIVGSVDQAAACLRYTSSQFLPNLLSQLTVPDQERWPCMGPWPNVPCALLSATLEARTSVGPTVSH